MNKRLLSIAMILCVLATLWSGAVLAEPEADIKDMSLLVKNTVGDPSAYIESRTQQAMINECGVRLEIISADDSKLAVLLAGGDLPDMVLLDSILADQLIEGNQIIPLDDLLVSNGADIMQTIPDTVEFSRQFFSETGKVYLIPTHVGATVSADETIGWTFRWDLYAEEGYPTLNDYDDVLDMLYSMYQKHPTTADGLPTYPVSMFVDWGDFCFYYPMMVTDAVKMTGNCGMVFDVVTNEMYNALIDPESTFWRSVDFYYKANQMGIFDPDGLTQSNDDFNMKCTTGQVFMAPATWSVGSWSKEHDADAAAFQIVPFAKGGIQSGSKGLLGWTATCYGISSNCEDPERAMDFINYMYSYDGLRTLYSGVEGIDWTWEDGLLPETIELMQKGGDEWSATGIGYNENYMGLSPSVIHPKDNRPISLLEDPTMFTALMTNTQKAFSEHFGVSNPREYYDQQIAEGNLVDYTNLNNFASALMPTVPDDISRISAALNALEMQYGSECIMAANDEEFAALKTEAIDAFINAGAQTVEDWYSENWNAALEKTASLEN